jgi:hypothetical protein
MNPLVYQAASRFSILPLTSRCGVACLFCSHRYNPPGVRAVFFGQLAREDVLELFDLLDPRRKIVIGESATRLCEGEPLSHPDFATILQALRRKFPRTPIQLTSNGTHLTRELVKLLADSQPLELMISLNSAEPRLRRQLMGPHRAEETLAQLASLPAGVPWHASIVLMPQVTGWGDVEDTIHWAQSQGAKSIRLLRPGFSRLAPVDWQALASVPGEARLRMADWRRRFKAAITLEPPGVTDLVPEVAGILPGSPAEGLIQPGDVVVSVGCKQPFSRVEAFREVFEAANPRLILARQGKNLEISLVKAKKAPSGLVMDYDLSLTEVDTAHRMAGGARKVLLLTSQPALPLWQLATPDHWQVAPVEACFFGGTIQAAGLLTVADYRVALAKYPQDFERVLLPPISFDAQGEDLVGEKASSLEDLAPVCWS